MKPRDRSHLERPELPIKPIACAAFTAQNPKAKMTIGSETMAVRGLKSGAFISLVLICFSWIGGIGAGWGQARPSVFSTWEGFEVDKCASIWLIKRFVNPNAVIKFFPKGEMIKEGLPFDTPDAQLRRYHNLSTFESIVKEFRVGNPGLNHIGRIVHDAEVNVWGKKRMKETRGVQKAVNDIISESKDKEEVIARSCKYFDHLYRQVSPN